MAYYRIFLLSNSNTAVTRTLLFALTNNFSRTLATVPLLLIIIYCLVRNYLLIWRRGWGHKEESLVSSHLKLNQKLLH